MKEFSVEEKAKRYDEAIGRAKEQLEGAKVFDYKDEQIAHDIRTTIYEIFPELKEESDEEIVKLADEYYDKVLIKECGMKEKEAHHCRLSYIHGAKAMLEKQGEHQKFRDSIQVGDRVTRNEDGVLVNLSQLNRVAKREEPTYTKKDIDDAYLKGLEDAKSTEINEDPCKDCDDRAANCHNFPCDKKKAFDEQKPVWSEEDGELYREALVAFASLYNELEPAADWGKLYSWFKSLKDRVQPKQEWSEEDEKHIMAIDLAVNRCAGKWHCCGEECPIFEHISWLKSLRPKSQWKPSDEQIEVLDNFIYAKYPNTEKYGEVIKSLYDDLKKLKD